MSDTAPCLAIRGLCHRYGPTAVLSGVDLEVAAGEIHGLVGPSGSGKSTLLRLIAGLEAVQAGRIEVAGRLVAAPGASLAPERRGVGFVFQDYALFPHLDARSNVAFGIEAPSRRARRALAQEWLERVGLGAFGPAMPHTLSGGQQQRVALARALARRPALMLLDEPFSGLDAELREEVRSFALGVLCEAGVATVLVTHDPREALAVAHRVSLLRGGRLLQTGTAAELYQRPASVEVAQAFGPVNRLIGRVEGGAVPVLGQTVPAPGWPDGTEVQVLLRPEALHLGPEGGVPARQLETLFEGPHRRLRLELEDGTRLEALEPSTTEHDPTEPLRVRCDPTAAHLLVKRGQ